MDHEARRQTDRSNHARKRENEGKEFGVVVLAEGLAEFLPYEYVKGVTETIMVTFPSRTSTCMRFFHMRSLKRTRTKTGQRPRKVKGLQLGYESRCAKPHAFDVMLGSQLRRRCLSRPGREKNLNGVMVSVSGQLELHYEPFDKPG